MFVMRRMTIKGPLAISVIYKMPDNDKDNRYAQEKVLINKKQLFKYQEKNA